MSNLVTAWTEDELLATDPGIEPLVVGGYRCHGGFDDGGRYHSPRTRDVAGHISERRAVALPARGRCARSGDLDPDEDRNR